MSSIKRYIWIAAVLAGVIFVATGAVMLVQGANAKAAVKDGLVQENVTIGADAALFGQQSGVLVDSAATAKLQADIIHFHSLAGEDKQVVDGKIVGGTPYSGMKRDDPARATYLDGVTLRSSLMLAYMGFKVGDLVMGLGAAFILIGVSTAGLLAPALYWAPRPATEAEAETAKAARQALATTEG